MSINFQLRTEKRHLTKQRCNRENVRTRPAHEIKVWVHGEVARRSIFIDSFHEQNIFCNGERIFVEVNPVRIKR